MGWGDRHFKSRPGSGSGSGPGSELGPGHNLKQGSEATDIVKVARVHQGYVMVAFTCPCRLGNGPELLRGTDIAAVCALCRTIYAITKVEFDRSLGHVQPIVTVSTLGTAPANAGPGDTISGNVDSGSSGGNGNPGKVQ